MVDLERFMMPLRIVQAVFALIVLGLLAYYVHFFDQFNVSAPDKGAFLLFCGIWGFVMAIILLAVEKMAKPRSSIGVIAVAAIDVITTIFFLAGWIAAATLNGLDCGQYSGNVFGSLTACRCIVTGIVFAAFSMVLWIISSYVTVPPALEMARGSGGGGGGGGGNPAPPA